MGDQADTFGRYVVVELLGRGAMGEVYRARDDRLNRDVALKVLRPARAADRAEHTEAAARLHREAQAVGSLEHPNIVAVYDVGEHFIEGQPEPSFFIAMELVRGETLRAAMKRGDAPIEQRVRWALEVARALAYAHQAGIVHRDVKPDNVMVRTDGVVKVLDFGIARRETGRGESTSSELPSLTEKGVVLGTPRYMAPEQMLGEELDGRADQFAWGVLAYELLSGCSPWPTATDSIQAVAEVLVHPPAPLRTRAPGVSPEIVAVVERAIQRRRDRRFPTMGDVVAELEAVTLPHDRDEPTTVTRVRRGLTRRRGPAVFVAAGLAAILAGVLLARSRPAAVAPSIPKPAPVTNAECTKRLGAASVAGPSGSCSALASTDCHPVAEPSAMSDPRTVWIGAMFPLTGPDAATYGAREFAAVDLARADFAQIMAGMNASAEGGGRPIGLVACDDAIDPMRAAHHLVDDVGVPAVIGFRTSKEAIDVATSILIPKGVVTLVALNTSPLIAKLPRGGGPPRLVWRTTYSAAETARPIGLLVAQVLEPALRAMPRVVPAGSPLRVAVVRQDDAAGLGFADALFRTLRFNGRSALENESSYRELVYPFDADPKSPVYAALAAKLVAFAPHVIVNFGADSALVPVLAPLERDWTETTFRPRYIKAATLSPLLFDFIGKNGDLRRRIVGLTSVSSTTANALFVDRYNQKLGDSVTRNFSPNASYDAFYVAAYATYALGDQPLTGLTLARAIPRLLPPGTPVDVGPSGIFGALSTLAAGGHIDLNGATGGLDFDLATGDAPVDLAVLCVAVASTGPLKGAASEAVESGLRFDAAAGALRGVMRCP